MTTLRLALDARGMEQGAAQAEKALDRVSTRASSVDQSLGRIDRSFQRAGDAARGSQQQFVAFDKSAAGLSGVVGASNSIARFGKEIQDAGTSMQSASNAAFGLGVGLLEISRVQNDLRDARIEAEKLGQSSNLLAVLWRAHPLLLITGGLAAVGAAMAIFASDTKDATDATKALEEATKSLNVAVAERQRSLQLRDIRQQIGLPDQQPEGAEFFARQAANIRSNPREISVQDLAKALQLQPRELLLRLQPGELRQGETTPRLPFPLEDAAQRALQEFLGNVTEATLEQAQRLSLGMSRLNELLVEPQAAQRIAIEQGRTTLKQETAQVETRNAPVLGPGLQEAEELNRLRASGKDALDGYLESLRQEVELQKLSGVQREEAIAQLKIQNTETNTGARAADGYAEEVRKLLRIRAEGEKARDLDRFNQQILQEVELVGLSVSEREKQLAVLQKEQELKDRQLQLSDDEIKRIRESIALRQQANANKVVDDTIASLRAERELLAQTTAEREVSVAARQAEAAAAAKNSQLSGDQIALIQKEARARQQLRATTSFKDLEESLTRQLELAQLTNAEREKEVAVGQQIRALEEQGGTFTDGQIRKLERIVELRQQAAGRRQLEAYVESLRQDVQLTSLSNDERERTLAVIQAETIAKQSLLSLSETEKQNIREQISLRQQLLEARQLGQEVGNALGSAFFSAVNGINTARQALAQFLQQLAAIAQSRAINQIANLFGNIGASTASQFNTPSGGGGGSDLPYTGRRG